MSWTSHHLGFKSQPMDILIQTERLLLAPGQGRHNQLDEGAGLIWRKDTGGFIPEGWPSEMLQSGSESQLRRFVAGCEVKPWGLWFLLIKEKLQFQIAGTCGFKGAPNEKGHVELGYSTLPHFEGRGLATEASVALITWAFEQCVSEVQAKVQLDNLASQRVLEKCGFSCLPVREGDVIQTWRIRRRV